MQVWNSGWFWSITLPWLCLHHRLVEIKYQNSFLLAMAIKLRKNNQHRLANLDMPFVVFRTGPDYFVRGEFRILGVIVEGRQEGIQGPGEKGGTLNGSLHFCVLCFSFSASSFPHIYMDYLSGLYGLFKTCVVTFLGTRFFLIPSLPIWVDHGVYSRPPHIIILTTIKACIGWQVVTWISHLMNFIVVLEIGK